MNIKKRIYAVIYCLTSVIFINAMNHEIDDLYYYKKPKTPIDKAQELHRYLNDQKKYKNEIKKINNKIKLIENQLKKQLLSQEEQRQVENAYALLKRENNLEILTISKKIKQHILLVLTRNKLQHTLQTCRDSIKGIHLIIHTYGKYSSEDWKNAQSSKLMSTSLKLNPEQHQN